LKQFELIVKKKINHTIIPDQRCAEYDPSEAKQERFRNDVKDDAQGATGGLKLRFGLGSFRACLEQLQIDDVRKLIN